MAVELSDFVPSLLREINPPGIDLFTEAGEEDFTGYLSDAFWEASLDGFFEAWTCDELGSVDPVAVGGAELPRSGVSLVVIYAGIRILRNKILNMNTQFAAKAGPVEFEQQNSATMLVEQLKQLRAVKERLLDKAENGERLDVLFDGLSTRVYSDLSYYGGPELTGI